MDTPPDIAPSGRLAARAESRELLVASVLIDTLDAALAGQRALVIGDRSQTVAAALEGLGAPASVWRRFCFGEKLSQSWPTEGGFDLVTLRIPPSWDAFMFSVHGALHSLRAGGQLLIYGRNDEGIKSVAKRLKAFGTTTTIETKRRSRVLSLIWGGGEELESGLRVGVEAWLKAVPDPAGLDRDWLTLPGLFAKGGLDPATALLLSAVPKLYEKRVLDFGCGQGVVADAVLRNSRGCTVTGLDADALAIEAFRRNVPEAQAVLSDGWRALGRARFDRILSNPPIHAGKGEDFSVIEALITEAPQHLGRSGELWLVVQTQVPMRALLQATFKTVERVKQTPRFTVWRAR